MLEQVQNLAKINIIPNARRGYNPPRLHGLVYDIAAGVLTDLQVHSTGIIGSLAHTYGTEAAPLAAR